jgi:hypothetical protein
VKGVMDGHITGTEKRGVILLPLSGQVQNFYLRWGEELKFLHIIYKRNTDVNSVPLLSTYHKRGLK